MAALLLFLIAAPASADPDEDRYRAAPNAALAEQIARKHLANGHRARAMNWAERAVRTPGGSAALHAWVSRLRNELKWQLGDDGFGLVAVNVKPGTATVTVNGKDLLPHGVNHIVWLSEGTHSVSASAPDHAMVEQLVSAARGEKRTVDLVLPLTRLPVLELTVEPDCEVWVDGFFVGRSSKKRFKLKDGPHLLELRLEKYLSWVQQLVFGLGEVKSFAITLAKAQMDVPEGPRGSNVDRPVMPSETEETAERSRLGERPDVASPLDRLGTRPKSDGRDAQGKLPDRSTRRFTATPGAGRDEAGAAEPDRSDAGSGPASAIQDPRVTTGAPDAPSTPWKATTKGWMSSTVGLAAIAAGVGMAVVSAKDAETANQLPRGSKAYQATYDKAATGVFTGYVTAGGGALFLGVGAAYLFGKNGLGRTGKGVLLTTVGTLAGGAAAFLLLDASALATDANKLPLRHVDYNRRFDLAEKNTLLGYGTAGVATALVGTGLYLAMTKSGSSASHEGAPTRLAVVPWLQGPGVSVALGWN